MDSDLKRNIKQEKSDSVERVVWQVRPKNENREEYWNGSVDEERCVENTEIEAWRVVWEKVDNVACAGFKESRFAKTKRLPVDQTAAGHSDLHADFGRLKKERIDERYIEQLRQYDAGTVNVDVLQGFVAFFLSDRFIFVPINALD